jgi:hypothetical protein
MGTGVPWYEAALIIGVNALVPLVIFLGAFGVFKVVEKVAVRSRHYSVRELLVVTTIVCVLLGTAACFLRQ